MIRLAVLAAMLCVLACSRAEADPPSRRFQRLAESRMMLREALAIAPITAELRAKGFDECNPPDPMGLGAYAPFVRVPLGRMLIPQKGGHTPDMGYDVLVHFHGADPVRKLMVQSARGVVLVLVDMGVGGGGYSRALGSAEAFRVLRRGIEEGLRRHTGNKSAHIRHLAVSSWSAGYAAVGKIIQQRHKNIDAYIILDGLHGVWRYGARHMQDPSALDARTIDDEIALAKRALRGETTFVLTHSRVDPGTYPGTSATAALLVRELGLKSTKLSPEGDRFGQISSVDVEGLHVWGFAGNEKLAHCKQLFQLPRIVSELLEPVWDTPEMDRGVKSKPLRPWKRAKRGKR